MAMTFDTDDVQDVDSFGGGIPQPGFCHMLVTDVDDTLDEYTSVILTMRILASTEAGNVGKQFTEYFSTSEKAKPRLKRLALQLGLLKPGVKGAQVNFQKTRGMQLVAKLSDNEYTDKKTGEKKRNVKIGWSDFWRVGHPDVAHVPIAKDIPKLEDSKPKDDDLDF